MTGRRTLPLTADVRKSNAVESAVKQAVAELGGLDIVVNNAAGNFLCASADLSPNGFGTVMDIDAKGTWNVSRAAYHAKLHERGGQILNISATLHYGGTPGQAHVAAAKAAVDALTRTLAVEWGPQGIRVNAIAPGPIGDTEGARRLFPGEAAEKLRAAIPTRRLGSIDDIVNLALFVLSDAGSNLNGEVLVSDGGLCLTGSFARGFETASDMTAQEVLQVNLTWVGRFSCRSSLWRERRAKRAGAPASACRSDCATLVVDAPHPALRADFPQNGVRYSQKHSISH